MIDLLASFSDSAFWFLVLLTPLVFVHELGHYLVARWCGVRVDVFSIGFGPEIFGWKARNGTHWKISAIPLGGYIKMFGEHAIEPDADGHVRDLSDEEQAVSFQGKRLSQRAAIVFAGPAANYVFAIVVAAAMFVAIGQYYTPPRIGGISEGGPAAAAGLQPGDTIVSIGGASVERFEDIVQLIRMAPGEHLRIDVLRDGEPVTLDAVLDEKQFQAIDGTMQNVGDLGLVPYIPATVGRVVEGSAAEEAGLQAGDRIVSIDSAAVERFDQIQGIIRNAPGRALTMVVERGGVDVVLTVTPRPVEERQETGPPIVVGQLGVAAERLSELIRYDPVTALWRATQTAGAMTRDTLKALGQIVTGKRDSKEMGGPIMIAQVSGKVAQAGPLAFIELMIFFSINLGLINLLPVPVLDGGHLAFYAVEAVRGRPVGERAQEFSFKIGLALVLSLMIFVTVNDLLHRVF